MNHPEHFGKIHSRVTRLFKMRLQWACEQRERETARKVPEGEILSELAIHLDPHPEEGETWGPAPTPIKARTERKKRGRAPRVA